MTQKIKCRESYDRGYQKGKELVNDNAIKEVIDSLNRLDETLIIEALLDLGKKYDTEFMSLYIKVLMKKISYHADAPLLGSIYEEIDVLKEAN